MEVHMKKLLVIAALALISSTSADAATREFKFGGRTMRVEIPKNCKKFSCMSVKEKEKSGRKSKSTESTSYQAPATAAAGTVAAGTAAAATVAPQPRAEEKPVETQVQRERDREVVRSEPKSDTADERRSVARLSLPSNAVEEVKRTPATPAAAPAKDEDEPKAAPKAGNSPLGVWVTEKNAGRVRIEACGSNLCGHTVEKDGSNGKKVLIDMKASGSRWNGRINDVRSGKIYASHMSMRGANGLRVEGCAFGGLFCGGETWKRAE
jgi:uncharacterized protein (DUF2147 family)